MMIMNKRKVRLPAGQATLEFAFTFIIVVLILYGSVRIMQWLGLSIGTPGQKHYQGLYSCSSISGSGYVFSCCGSDPSCHPYSQLQAAESASVQTLPPLRAVFTGQLFNP